MYQNSAYFHCFHLVPTGKKHCMVIDVSHDAAKMCQVDRSYPIQEVHRFNAIINDVE